LVFKLSWVFYNPLPKTCTGTKINLKLLKTKHNKSKCF
jgi:hypothetical protein